MPIVEKGPLDALYRRVGALVIDGWKQLTPELLDREYEGLRAVSRNATDLLSPAHWRREIERDRRSFLPDLAADRTRCWGSGAKAR